MSLIHGRWRVWFAGVLSACAALCAPASADPWLDFAPADAAIVIVFDRLVDADATDARDALAEALAAPGRLEQTRRAWAELAGAMGLDETELTSSFFGGRTMLIVQRIEPEPEWALLAEVEDGLPRRMIRSLKAAPRDIREGVPVLSLERGRYTLAARRDRDLGRSWLLISPRGSEALFDRMLPAMRRPSEEAHDRVIARVRIGGFAEGGEGELLIRASPEGGAWSGRIELRRGPARDTVKDNHAVQLVRAPARPEGGRGVNPAQAEAMPDDGLLLIRGGRTAASELVFRSFAGMPMPETPEGAPVSVLVAGSAESGARVMLGVGRIRDADRYDALLAGNGAPDFKGLFPHAIRRAGKGGRCLSWSFASEPADARDGAESVLLLRVARRQAGAAEDLALIRETLSRTAGSEATVVLARPSRLGGLETEAPAMAHLGADTLPLLGTAELVRIELRPTENGAVRGSFLVKFRENPREP